MTHPLEDPQAFKFFAQQHPKEMSLLREVIFRWKRSHAFASGLPGKWAAWLLDEWCAWLNPPAKRRTLQRWLKLLDDNGLIERGQHQIKGRDTRLFLRPTELALKLTGNTAYTDRLTTPTRVAKKGPKKPSSGAPNGAGIGAPNGAPIGAPDHTSIPFHSSHSGTQKIAHAHAPAKGKEGIGEKAKKKLVLKKKKIDPETPIPPATPQQIDAEIAAAKMEAKEARAKKLLPMLLKKFPIWEGQHRKGPNPVWHPYEKHGLKWAMWTPAKIVERYAVYEEYVANWYVGKQGKPYKPFSDEEAEIDFPGWTEEDDAHWDQLGAASNKPSKK